MNEILYREFWIKADRTSLEELTHQLQTDDRVEDFDKIDSCCNTDKKSLVSWLEWMITFVEEHADMSDRKAEEMKRKMELLKEKLQRMIK